MRHFKAFVHTLWLARVSCISLIVAAIGLNLVPQAEDLLLDYRGIGNSWFWLIYNVVFFVWALGIYYFARVAIESRYWARNRLGDEATPAEFATLARYHTRPSQLVPLLLGLLAFAVVGYAAWQARANIPLTVTIDAGADDLVDQLRQMARVAIAQAVLFLLVVFLGRYLLHLRAGRKSSFRWLPPFQPELAAEIRGTGVLDNDAGTAATPAADGGRLARAVRARPVAWLLGVMSVVVFLLAAFAPAILSEPPRAILLFIILAGWVPIATALVVLGYMWRWPVLASAVAVLALMPVVFGDNHAIELQRAGAAPEPVETGDDTTFVEAAGDERFANPQQAYVRRNRTDIDRSERRPDIDTWIRRWKRANGCSAEGACPTRPILVAASGGASRAAFFTGSALGAMLDATCPAWTETDTDPASERCEGRPALLDQVFAISSVSGSSLTTVLLSRLLAVSDAAEVPCAAPTDGAHASDLWYGSGAARSWRRCLELLTAGDYLSPTFAALASRDVFPSLFPEDRVKVLERAFADHVDWVLGEGVIDLDGEGFLASYTAQLDCPDPGCDGNAWRPLVIANGSSVRTGARIVTTPIAPEVKRPETNGGTGDGATADDVFRASLDFHELAACPTARCDLTLATAVTNSARFPVVSAHGDIVDPDGVVVDEIVDGGYFESIGVTSLVDMARHLRRNGLSPAVVVITNDPAASRALVEPSKSGMAAGQVVAGACDDEAPSWLDRLSPDIEQNFLETVRLPLRAVLNARGARGIASLEDVEALVRLTAPTNTLQGTGPAADAPASTTAIHIGVEKPCNVVGHRMDNISMSWWLSKPVQATLSEQIFSITNFGNFLRVCRLMDGAAVAEACRSYFVGRYQRFTEALARNRQ